ncbi:hypothetical protein K1719_039832 [Acacia pycnantha]|nr:hypothetical protein K1719_039832 [Acacia pycnantha]
MDPYKFLHIVLNPDGTITRLEKHPETPAQPDPNPHLPVLSKDLSINPLRNTWARIFLPHQVTDLVWELSLPVGADRDHEYSNPTAEKGSKVFDNITRLGWKVIVFGCYGDPLIDRQIDLAKSLQKHDATWKVTLRVKISMERLVASLRRAKPLSYMTQ